ncbi:MULTISPECIES: hypothetical protein [Pseudothermotoga]|uniref:Uncharacterized protein n=1 Tax=Pseudothermotoga lettingae (strain ATCC BAA-301 / DSM 14385 / NBRC 107922 / TMO) TaxID=416591 RepID=A8F8F4_PSELT|nr:MULTISPECIES: hypothetical protein [Pseudothermotoga]ABV34438.1 conserved hypothetical protein [Pseudothermotoga lettingae TMO]GLI48617.1 hypothetical protein PLETTINGATMO_07860 [Pseudothermotoga lettingae TMO]HBJ80962.1 hypothetical protein [Pseudothermotoga sp.]
MKKFLYVFLILACTNIFSQGTFNIRLDPLVVTKSVAQGSQFSYEVYLENSDPFNSVTIEAKVEDVVEDINGMYNIAPAGSTKYSAAKWIRVDPEIFTISPGSGRQVTVNVSVPRGVAGGRYAAVVFKIVPPEQTPQIMEEAVGFAVQFQFQLASFLELTVETGRRRIEAYAVDFEVQKINEIPSLVEIANMIGKDATVFSVSVLNKSNLHVQTTGELTIKTSEGRTLVKMPLGSGRGVILPETTVKVRSITTRKFPPGDYIAKAVVNYGGHRPAIVETQFSVKGDAAQVEQTKVSDVPMFYIEPGNIELRAMPRTFRSTLISVTNRGDEVARINASIYPLEYDINGELVPIEDRQETVDWVEVSPDSFELKPNQTRKLRIIAKPPEDALGGYYFDLVFSSSNENVKTEFGANLLVYVGSDETIVKKLSADFHLIQPTTDGLNVDVLIKNDGNYHIIPSIIVGLEKVIPQQEEESGIILPESTERLVSASYSGEVPILPGAERIYGVMLPIQMQPGEYEVVARIDFGDSQPIILRKRIRLEGGEEK